MTQLVLSLLAVILLTQYSPVFSHGLSPSRLEAPSGSPLVAYRFKALNYYDQTALFGVECFKGALSNPYPCNYSPKSFYVPSKKDRSFKVQFAPDADGIYLVCTIEQADKPIITRVCARFGVGVPANLPTDGNRVNPVATNTSIPSGSRQNKIR